MFKLKFNINKKSIIIIWSADVDIIRFHSLHVRSNQITVFINYIRKRGSTSKTVFNFEPTGVVHE
jgi:hypothetical protein